MLHIIITHKSWFQGYFITRNIICKVTSNKRSIQLHEHAQKLYRINLKYMVTKLSDSGLRVGSVLEIVFSRPTNVMTRGQNQARISVSSLSGHAFLPL